MIRFAGIVGVLVVWEVAAATYHSPMLCSVTVVAPALWALRYDLAIDAMVSLRTLFMGYGIAVAVGIVGGIALAKLPTMRLAIMPVVESSRSVAALAFFPLLIMVLGLGITAKAFVIFWTAWPAILINTMHGIRQADRRIVEAATLDGANRRDLLWFVELPLALPTMIAGLRIGASGGWISLVAAEMLGSSAGLGFSVLSYSQSFQFPAMYAAIVIIAATGLVVNHSLYLVQSRSERLLS